MVVLYGEGRHPSASLRAGSGLPLQSPFPAPLFVIPDLIRDPGSLSLSFPFLCLRSRVISWRFFAWPHCEPHEACPCPRAGMRPLQLLYNAAKSSPVIQGPCFSPGGWSIINIHMWMPQCKDSLMMNNQTGHTMLSTLRRRPKIISNSTPPPPPNFLKPRNRFLAPVV